MQNDMHNIQKLENHQLGLHYEVISQKLNNIQKDITENIINTLGKKTEIDYEKTNLEESSYRTIIQKENKEMFLLLKNQKKEIEKEIAIRQKQMLKDINISSPSIRVEMIMEETKGEKFPIFDRMIQQIKMIQKGKNNKTRKKIYEPEMLTKIFKILGKSPINILKNNEGPSYN